MLLAFHCEEKAKLSRNDVLPRVFFPLRAAQVFKPPDDIEMERTGL
jgi:hypothetical protein